MADIEKEVEALIYAGLGDGERDTEGQPLEAPAAEQEPEETEEQRVIDVDLYRLPGGAVLLVPGQGTHPLDANVVESDTASPDTTVPPQRVSLEETAAPQQEEDEPALSTTPTAPFAPRRSRVKASSLLMPLILVVLLAGGAASYVFLLPLTATATVTITPDMKTLHTQTTLTIAASPRGNQVQGRTLAPFSLTASTTVPATGHGHQDATSATGVITFYNSDANPITIPAGVTLTAPGGATIVTDTPVTVQAAVLPEVGSAITPAYVAQVGSIGNIPARAIYTRCCGSVFVTATNNVPFSGGQDARDYSFVQSSDIHNAASSVLERLTPKVSAALYQQARSGEQSVTPLCTPHTSSSKDPGEEAASVTVSVTQTCRSAVYSLDSLEQVATALLAQRAGLTRYQQVGTVQVTVNGSTYTRSTVQLHVGLTGVWVYHFSPGELSHLRDLIAGATQENAKRQLEKTNGIQQVSIHISRLDLKNTLPTDTARIHMVFFVVAQVFR